MNCESKSELYVCSLPLFILNRAGKNAAHTKLDSLVDSKHYAFFSLVEMRKSCIALEMMFRFLLTIKSFPNPLSRFWIILTYGTCHDKSICTLMHWPRRRGGGGRCLSFLAFIWTCTSHLQNVEKKVHLNDKRIQSYNFPMICWRFFIFQFHQEIQMS